MKKNLKFLTRAGTDVPTETSWAESQSCDANNTITALGVFCLKTKPHFTNCTGQKN